MDKVSVNQLGYVGIGVSNMLEWEDYATQVLGMQAAGNGTDGSLLFRMDNYHHRLILEPNGKDDISFAGWQVKDDDELEVMASQLKNEGFEIHYGTSAEAKQRHVSGLIRTKDPSDITTEIFFGPEVLYGTGFKSPRNITGFVTHGMGVGHIVLAVNNFDKCLQFYRRTLGFKASDVIRQGPEVGGAFMHVNPRHHSLALNIARSPEGNPPYGLYPAKRLQHVMIQLQSLDDVGSTYYLAQKKGLKFSKELGRHGNDYMVSFYVMTPSGFAIEYGWGARNIDDSTWQLTYGERTPWEHIWHTPPEKIRDESSAEKPR